LKIKIIAIASLVFFFAAPAFAAENIRVAIADNEKAVTLASSSGLTVAGVSSSVGRDKKISFGSASLVRALTRIRSVAGFISVNGKNYRGWVEVRRKKNGRFLVINELGIEDYLKGVIGAEIPNDWEFQALKAQAVASRTYALYQKRAAGSRAYHVRATTADQVYNGGAGEKQNTLQAVKDTQGLVLVYEGEVIPAFYHSSCGGHTENAAELWGIDEPYLHGVDCECQEISKYGLWEKRISVSQVTAALKRIGYRLNAVEDMTIASMTPAGRVKSIVIRTGSKTTLVPGETLRAAIGNSVIPSVFFELELLEGKAVFSGRGRGHGVGLCQWGAREMAQRGYDFRSILMHYYPGTSLARME
jgi:stage II sporulation protein D